MIKSKQATGISELSLFILNIGNLCLACNSLILNWWKFECYQYCGFFLCSGNLLAFYQILVGWLIVFPLYIIFVKYKLRDETVSKKSWFFRFSYLISYLVFFLVVVLLLIIEKFTNNDTNVFDVIAYILGIFSMIASGIVWVPQIVKLIRTQEKGGLSLLMFIIQTPGSAIIIIFQAILNKQNWSTWLSYVFTLAEQLTIVILLIRLKYKKWKEMKMDFHNTTTEFIEDGLYSE